MEIDLHMRGGRRADWWPLLRHRLQMALRRHALALTRVRVSLEDVNGPRGGMDKRCSLLLALRDGRQLRLSEQTDHWTTAFAAALHRATQLLRKQQARGSQHRHAPLDPHRLTTPETLEIAGALDAKLPR